MGNLVTSNVPREQYVYVNGNQYGIGTLVRILLENRNECIGRISIITENSLCVEHTLYGTECIAFSDIYKMKSIDVAENLDNVPYFDEEEREFWKKHVVGRNGITLRVEV